MKTMKVIDLLNRIANGEALPNKFSFYNITYYLQDNKCFKYCYRSMENELFEKHFILEDLNREIEIIEDTPKEDKKIEKVKLVCCYSDLIDKSEFVILYLAELKNKINEIIDRLNGDK